MQIIAQFRSSMVLDTPLSAARLLPLLGVLLAVQPRPAGAQRAVSVGVEGGAALTNFSGGTISGNDWRTTPWIGLAVVAQRPASVVGFQTGLQFVSKGAAFGPAAGAVGAVRLPFVEVPLLLRLGPTSTASRVRPALLVGGSVGVRVGCSVTGELSGTSRTLTCDEAFFGSQADVQRFDAGLSIGGELGIPYKDRLLIAPMVRYTRGLIDIADDGTDDYRSKNTAFQIGVSLRAR